MGNFASFFLGIIVAAGVFTAPVGGPLFLAVALSLLICGLALYSGISAMTQTFGSIAGIPVHLGVGREKFPLLHKIHYKFCGPEFDDTVVLIRKNNNIIDDKTKKIKKATTQIKKATTQIKKAKGKKESEKALERVKEFKKAFEREKNQQMEYRDSSVEELVKNNLLLFYGFKKGLVKIRDKTGDFKVMELLINQMYKSYTGKAKADIIKNLKNDTKTKINKYQATLKGKSSYQITKYHNKIKVLEKFKTYLSNLPTEQNSSNK